MCGLPCRRTQLEDTPQPWHVIEQFRTPSVGCSFCKAARIHSATQPVRRMTEGLKEPHAVMDSDSVFARCLLIFYVNFIFK